MSSRPRYTWKFEKWHVIHVLPEGDSHGHEPTPNCWCEPVAHACTSGDVYHHIAADGRPGYGGEGDRPGAWRLVSRFEADRGRHRERVGAGTRT